MTRGSGKFKAKRGGGRNFSRNLTLDENGTAVAVERKKEGEDDSDEDEEDEEEEEEEEEESSEEESSAPASGSAQPELSRSERKELKKQSKAKKEGDAEDEDDDPLLVNPNRSVGRMKISDLNAPRELTRREREQKDKADAKEKYWKLHAQGRTDESRADLARLAKIRAEREAAQAKRKAEQDAKAAEMETKRAGGKR